MPTRYWRNLPEAARISALTQTAHQRSAQMVAAKTTVPRRRRIAGAPAAKPAQQTSHHGCNGHGDFYNNNEREVGEDVATTTAAMHYRASEPVQDLFMGPAWLQNRHALGARRSPYACMGKVGNDERGGFGAMPLGLPRKGCVRSVANPRRVTSPAVVAAIAATAFAGQRTP